MERKQRGLDGFTLKLIAAFAMLCSHIYRALLFSHKEFLILDLFGRLSFPIFCFLLAEGFCYTKDRNAYLIRLWVFAVVSEIPFNLAFFGRMFAPEAQNVLFTMFTGLLVLWGMEKVGKMWRILPILAGMACAYWLHMDYGFYGIWIIVLFGILQGMKKELLYLQAGSQFCSVLLYGWIQIFSLLSLPLIYFYNGSRGRSWKYFFYLFYPLHLLLLVGIRLLCMQY